MDEKTLQVLTALANKLGVTAQYLWSVLLRQAPITGAIDLFLLSLLVFGVWRLTRYVYRRKPGEWGDDEGFFRPLAWAGVGIVVFVTTLIVCGSLSDTVAGLVNPEYWALKQVLPK
jgi:hypothetical protein